MSPRQSFNCSTKKTYDCYNYKMADVFSKKKRSEVMSLIRGHGNKETELAMIRVFREQGITGWRRKQAVFGKPDFVFYAFRLAVFVDGCFWHCCPTHRTRPKNNQEFWEKKLGANCARDREVTRELKAKGWRVLRIWEHELKKKNERRLVSKLRRHILKPTEKT